MIELKNVSKYYNNNGNVSLGLRNVNLKLGRGEIVAIVGESGAGKSTLLNVICGVDTYEEGEINFKGNETSYFSSNDKDIFRKKYVGFIYQQYNLIDNYSVLENVMLPLLMNGQSYAEAKEKALEYIEKVGLTSRLNHKGIKLSGGEKQRCVIARALASNCEILACDEPTGNLDNETGKQIISLIQEISKDKLVLIVTHNYEQVENIVTRTIKVADGEIIEDYKKSSEAVPLEQDEINLNSFVIKWKTLLWVAFQNLKNTPRKTLFSFVLMTLVSFLFLFLAFACLSYQDAKSYTQNPYYNNTIHNRLVVYDSLHQTLDEEKLNAIAGVKYRNAFYEDMIIRMDYDDSLNGTLSGNTKVLNGTFCHSFPLNYEVLGGEVPKEAKDCFILFPVELQGDNMVRLKNRLGRKLFTKILPKLDLTICGYGISSEIKEIMFIPYEDISFILSKLYTNNMEVSSLQDEKEEKLEYNYGATLNKPILYMTGPTEEPIDSICMYYNGVYRHVINDFDIRYNVSDEVSRFVILPYEQNVDELFEMTIYAENPDEAIRDIKKLGYEVVQPGKNGIEETLSDFLSFALVIAICVFASGIFTFIIYIIYLRVYSSKKIDFTVLRSLGFIKKYMSRVVIFEVCFVGFVSSIIAFLLMYALYFSPINAFQIVKFNTVIISLFYFLFILLLSFLIAKRFNRKLFKYSVSTSFKGDEVTND